MHLSIAASNGFMNSAISGGRNRRTSRFLFTSLLVAIIVLYEIWDQQRSIGSSLARSNAISETANQPAHDLLPESDCNDGHCPAQSSHQETEEQATPPSRNSATQPVVGKMTISFGEPDAVYDRAIRSHEYHNKMMGYPQFVLRERLLPGLWSKHAYIISVIVEELSKPEDQRLKWLMWMDRDTVLMNPLLQLEMFIPPAGFEHIHILTTNDRNGLNNGVFFFKVNEWSLKLFSTALTFPHYNPDVKLKYTEQSALEEVLQIDWYNQSATRVPQRWFNAFPPPPAGAKWKKNHGRPGQLLLHFASNRDGLRPQRMTQWMDVAEKEVSEWRVPLSETNYPHQIDEYWRRLKSGENADSIIEVLEDEE